MNFEAQNFYYSNDTISGDIKSLALNEKISGLEIDSLHTRFMYASTASYLKDLYLKTPNTLLQDKVVLQYPSLDALQNQPEKVTVDASLQHSKIGFQDVLLFAPQLKNVNPFKSHPNAELLVDGSLSGKLNDLQINNFSVSGIGQTRLALTGSIKGLPDVANAYYNLDIQQLHSTAADIHDFVPAGTIPSNIKLPQTLSLQGNFKGTSQNFNTDLNLNSSLGNATVNADVNLKKGAEKYDAKVALDKFDLGKLIQNDSIGQLTLNAQVKGTGLDPKTANASASGHVVQATYNSYSYNDVDFKGNIQNGRYHATAGLNDPNLDFDFEASGNLNAEHPSLQFTANLNSVDLDSLHLRNTPLKLNGKIKADLQTADPDYLNGKITLTNFTVSDGKQTYPLDTISIKSKATADSTSITLNSQIVNATVKGKYQLTKIGSALTKSISHYFSYPPAPETQDTLPPQDFNYDIHINNDPVLQQLVPALTVEQDISLHGNFNSKNDSLTVIGDFPALTYTGYKIRNAKLDVHPEGDALAYNLKVDDVSGGRIKLPNTILSGKIQDDEISYDLEIDDLQNKPRYEIAGLIKSEPDNLAISLDRKKLLLNYNSWNIPPNNSIHIADAGVWIKDFVLRNGSDVIRINSPGNSPKAPIDIDFENFKLETLSAMVSKDTLLAGGKMNGEIVIHDLTSKTEFTSDLLIENFNFKKDTIGNVKMEVNNHTANKLSAQVTITGQDNNVSLAGTYNMADGGLDMNLDMKKLHVKSIQGFSFGSIAEGKGYLSGNLKIAGTASEPKILGGMKFNDVGFRVS
ncbi:MAG: translocation/assembly module TamB, partial [Gillisia sp.]